MRGLETFDPLNTEETIYPFAIDKNVCGADRVSRLVGAVMMAFVAIKLLWQQRYASAGVAFIAVGALTLNALTQRCILSEVLGVTTCDEPREE